MSLPPFQVLAPASLKEACLQLEKTDSAQIIAGGTDLMMALRNGLKKPSLLIDLGQLQELRQVVVSPQDGVRLGALVSLRQLIRHPLIRARYPLLVEAARTVGSPQIQSMGTLGGNLLQDSCCVFFNRPQECRQALPPCHKLQGCVCHVVPTSLECWATYAGDLAPVLLVLDAKVEVAGTSGKRVCPLQEIFSGDGSRPHTLKQGDILTQVLLPEPLPKEGGSYQKLRTRQSLDYPLVGAAALLAVDQKGRCSKARLALTAVDRAPLLRPEAGWLEGKRLTEEQIERVAAAVQNSLRPVKNLYGPPAAYRRRMAGIMVRRALLTALQRLGGTLP